MLKNPPAKFKKKVKRARNSTLYLELIILELFDGFTSHTKCLLNTPFDSTLCKSQKKIVLKGGPKLKFLYKSM